MMMPKLCRVEPSGGINYQLRTVENKLSGPRRVDPTDPTRHLRIDFISLPLRINGVCFLLDLDD
jgi:hypothetical protein